MTTRDETPDEQRDRERMRGISWLTIVWFGLAVILWVMPLQRRQFGELRSTNFGILHWKQVSVRGRTTIHGVALTTTIALSAAVTAWMTFAGGRIWRNTTPRWKCRNCGHDSSMASGHTNVCTECGELPNEKKDPWAFWR